MGLPSTIQPPQTDYSLVLHVVNGNHDQNMHYLCSHDIYFSKMQYMSVYDVIDKTLGHTHPVIYIASDMGEYVPPKKEM